MNNTEAKFILSAYRPGGRDACDPAMAEALAQAARDPKLGAWLARQQAHGNAVAAKLGAIAPPAGLRDAILAGGRASGQDGTDRRAWWARPAWMAMAAAAALLLSFGMWWRFAPVRGATLEEFAVNFVDRGFELPKHSADFSVLKAWLGEQHGPLPETLPEKFAELRALGCRKLDFHGRAISLVCFERGGKEFHVFVARRDDVPDAADAAQRFLQRGKFVAATWVGPTNRYVLVSDAGLEAVKHLL